MKKLGHLLFTAAFLLACLIPGVGMAVFGPSEAAGNEVLAPLPRTTAGIDGSVNLNFLSDAADYFSDHFAFRQELVTADSALRTELFHSSSQPDVALGRDGWLFYAETLDDFTGADNLAPRQAYCIARSLKLAEDYAEGQGAAFVFTAAPNKLSLYPEHGPQGLTRAAATAADYAKEQLLAQGVNYADLFEALSVQEEELYLKLDSHWNNRGAALGHDLLLEKLGLSGNAFQKPGSYQDTHRGDLYEMLYPASGKLDRQFEFDDALQFEYTSPFRAVDDLRIQTASPSENGPLLMFRDSFGNALHSLMAEDFSAALFSRAMPYNLNLIGETGAQYVVVEIVERNLRLLADAPFQMPAPAVDTTKAPWGEGLLRAENCCLDGSRNLQQEETGEYTKITASCGEPCDADSPVYLLQATEDGGMTAWEAFPQYIEGMGEESTACTAYIESGQLAGGALHMVFRQGGRWKWALSDEFYRDPDSGFFPEGDLVPRMEG